ncbi:ABC transporter permease [Facklamia miroungae]|uniref:Putative spermidine/putrescine transport system permease protein n=1 Tax=Facklamia miroungae TaxID=120956 RepID=A0A1G7QN50_9LACT|nr:ABC transporter permease subunit [Facklamia miroungae]NKZ29003.1 ABC transporter permease subunit [Facklamia miroungae]SDF99942.1 putative spermidine/putrescine transport system permease protein [Facklamia miroungae]
MRFKIFRLFVLIAILLPIVILLVWAFAARWPWPQLLPQFFSLRGIESLISQPDHLIKLILSSTLISSLVAILSCIIALMTARAFVISKGHLKRVIVLSISLPFLIPIIVFATGIHQKMLEWGLANTTTGIILVHLVYSLPYASYLIIDAYQAVGIKLEEQAWLLGADKWGAFRKIVFPQLLPVLSTSLAISFVVSFSQYFLTLMIGGGQVQTLSIIIYPYLQRNDRTIASVYAIFFLIVTFLVMGLFNRLTKHYQKKYEKVEFY